mmetsp:Transcript_46566/g.91942  ORF Transcript_46566/g.91942 Transcript_46566/m.91942 type:complete len:682 (+) Transcript_46566:168-2213(+)
MGTEGKKSLGFLDKWWWYGCPEGLDHSFCSSDLGEEKYKELQTVAYDNPHGFSWVLLFEIYAFVFLMPVLLIVGQKVKENTGCTNARVFGIGSFFWDFLFVFGPPTLLMLAPPFLFLLVGYMGAFFLALCITLWQQGSSGKIDGIPVRVDERSRPLFLSTYRAVMMVSTCVAILAVDFLAFPRRFAKSLRLGFSLMDAGVGGVLFAGGAVSRWARGDKNSSPLLNSLARLWPLLVMGTARFVIIWVADKHVPATEYGVHWNFFFTLGVVAVGAVVAEKLVSPEHAWVLAALISGIYECFLCLGGGEEFILDSSRTNFFSSNREGILGCLGFLSVHLCGVSVGRGVFISFVEGEELTAEELNNQTSSGVELEGEKEKEKEKAEGAKSSSSSLFGSLKRPSLGSAMEARRKATARTPAKSSGGMLSEALAKRARQQQQQHQKALKSFNNSPPSPSISPAYAPGKTSPLSAASPASSSFSLPQRPSPSLKPTQQGLGGYASPFGLSKKPTPSPGSSSSMDNLKSDILMKQAAYGRHTSPQQSAGGVDGGFTKFKGLSPLATTSLANRYGNGMETGGIAGGSKPLIPPALQSSGSSRSAPALEEIRADEETQEAAAKALARMEEALVSPGSQKKGRRSALPEETEVVDLVTQVAQTTSGSGSSSKDGKSRRDQARKKNAKNKRRR